MKMKKRGQFYLIAVIIFAGIFMGIVTIKNSIKTHDDSLIKNSVNELNIEISKLLDYFAQNNYTIDNSNLIMENFSKTYTTEFGTDKDILFFYGETNNLSAYGYSLGDLNVTCDFSGTNVSLVNTTYTGNFNYNVNLGVGNNFSCYERDNKINYNFSDGRNIYYLILYTNSGGDYIFSN